MAVLDQVVVKQSLPPAIRTNGAANGTAVDRAANGGMQECVVLVCTGTLTDGAIAVTVEESDDGSTGWTAVPAAQLQGTLPTTAATDDNTVYEIGVRSTKRYIRVVGTTSGATSGGSFSAAVVLGAPRFSPVSHP
jgi:hypothetical protein